jgi:hypothetical protein
VSSLCAIFSDPPLQKLQCDLAVAKQSSPQGPENAQ